MTEHRVTRTVRMTRSALRHGNVPLPEGVTYIATGLSTPMGEFPHVPMWGGPEGAPACPAALLVIVGGGHQWEPWCTRNDEHELHVAHLQPGQPIAAWTDAP